MEQFVLWLLIEIQINGYMQLLFLLKTWLTADKIKLLLCITVMFAN